MKAQEQAPEQLTPLLPKGVFNDIRPLIMEKLPTLDNFIFNPNTYLQTLRIMIHNGDIDIDQWLIACAQLGHYNIVNLLLILGRTDPKARSIKTYIHDYNKKGKHIVNLKRLILTTRETNSLLISTKRGHTDVVRLLLEDGSADPKVMNSYCIRISAEHGYTDIVKLLLEDGRADPKAMNSYCLRKSIENSYSDVVQVLLEDENVDPLAAIGCNSNRKIKALLKAALTKTKS